jgi:hypothetical protein
MTATQLPPNILARLNSDGVSAGWVGDQLGVGKNTAGKLLRSIGAQIRGGRWFMPGVARPPPRLDRQCLPSEFRGEVLRDRA